MNSCGSHVPRNTTTGGVARFRFTKRGGLAALCANEAERKRQ